MKEECRERIGQFWLWVVAVKMPCAEHWGGTGTGRAACSHLYSNIVSELLKRVAL